MERIRTYEFERDQHRKALATLLETAQNDGRALSPEETAKGDALSAKCDALDTKISAERASIEYDRHHAVAIAGPEGWSPTRREQGEPGAALKYRELFPGAVARDEHFAVASAFFEAVASGRWHPGLRAAMNEGSGSEGGFLTPSEYVAAAFDDALEGEVVRPRARVYAMRSDTLRVSGFSMDGSATGPFGFAPSWTGEGASITPSNPLVRRVNLTAKKLALLVQASNELAEDGQSYGQQLDRVMKNAIGWSLDAAFLQGNGAGEPLGVLNAPACISVAKESGQTAATVVAQNIYKMYARLLPSPGAYQRAVWVCSPTVIPQLFQLSIPVGVAGTALASIPSLFQSTAGAMTLLNLPVVPSEKMPTLGSAGDIGLFDFSYFAVGLRREVTLDRSQHLGFQSDLASFRAILRADGMPLLSQPFQPKAGDTLSPFVKLAARA